MVNPPVELYDSAVKLDKYLDDYTGGKSAGIERLLNTTLARVKGGLTSEYANIGADTIYEIVKGDILSEAEKKAYIGLAFRLTSTDLNFISDFITKSHIYTKNPEKVDKFTNMKEYFKAVNFATFEDYVNKIGFPYYKKYNKDFTIEDLKREASLRVIEDYLRTSPKIAAVTNADELILNEKDIDYLKDIFKDRLIIYPKGGHCGNMFYKENVDVMLFVDPLLLPDNFKRVVDDFIKRSYEIYCEGNKKDSFNLFSKRLIAAFVHSGHCLISSSRPFIGI